MNDTFFFVFSIARLCYMNRPRATTRQFSTNHRMSVKGGGGIFWRAAISMFDILGFFFLSLVIERRKDRHCRADS